MKKINMNHRSLVQKRNERSVNNLWIKKAHCQIPPDPQGQSQLQQTHLKIICQGSGTRKYPKSSKKKLKILYQKLETTVSIVVCYQSLHTNVTSLKTCNTERNSAIRLITTMNTIVWEKSVLSLGTWDVRQWRLKGVNRHKIFSRQMIFLTMV